MGWLARFNKAGDATYSAPSTSAAAIAITFTTHEPTATTGQTIADGSSPTVAETGEFMANVEQFNTNVVADIAAIKAQLAALAVDVADVRTKFNEGE